MEKDNRKYRICFIDYMWYVAEIWHERERTNLNGRMLLFWCWLFVLLIPLGVPPILRLFGWMIGLAIVIPLCFGSVSLSVSGAGLSESLDVQI